MLEVYLISAAAYLVFALLTRDKPTDKAQTDAIIRDRMSHYMEHGGDLQLTDEEVKRL